MTKKPWQIKGSKAAKAHMKKLRSMVGGGKKKKKSSSKKSTSTQSGGKSTTGKPKYPSLTKILLAGGIIALTTQVGAAAAERIVEGANRIGAVLGITVTGATLVVGAIAMKGASSAAPRIIGQKWRAFLRGFGLRP